MAFRGGAKSSFFLGTSLMASRPAYRGIKGGIYLNAKDKNLKLHNSFQLKYRENLEDLSWLINSLNNSIF